jgi:fermentation-respiration switch protein FrsA (DUF1100 family)
MLGMSDVMMNAARVLIVCGIIYVVLAVGAHLLSSAMIFPRPPTSYAPGPELIELTAPDGVKIYARHWANPKAKYTFLYLHGNYEDLGGLDKYLPQMVDHGYSVFAIDYRNYGLSGGKPTEANTVSDTALAYDYLRTRLGVPADRIIVFGYSLGSGPAVAFSLQKPIAGLVLQGAFVSAYRVLTWIPLFPGDKYTNLAKVPSLKIPVMVIHGTDDHTVPFWHGRKLYEAITARKQKLFVENGPHTRLAEFTGQRYWDELAKFVDSL